MIRWVEGRQGTGYFKVLLLMSKRLNFDVYLLKYPAGSEIPWHVDKVKEGSHHRLNIVLRKAEGGKFLVWLTDNYDGILFLSGRLNYFRPDMLHHRLTKVTKGTRYVLSIGWLTK